METFTRCVKCGAEKTAAEECLACGVIYAKAENSYVPPPPPVQDPPMPNLIACDICGKGISINAQACPHCGEPKQPQEASPPPKAKPTINMFTLVLGCLFVGIILLLANPGREARVERNKETFKDLSSIVVSTSDPQNFVTSTEYGDKWPYTIPEGRLSCTSNVVAGYQKQYITIEHAGVTYAINGSARSSGRYQPLEKIWRDNPAYPGSKIPDPGIIQKGLRLCD